MYIPRPAKLLFTTDNCWNKFLEKIRANVTHQTRLLRHSYDLMNPGRHATELVTERLHNIDRKQMFCTKSGNKNNESRPYQRG
uniref:hypothetical protein n=1 Tax=Escherichia coli TaxID=562 RepID=UPI003FA54944